MDVYLDNSATSPLSESMKEYLVGILDVFGNPSSMHSQGTKSKQIVDESRRAVAKFINANENNIYFTSGGSASNTLAIKGFYSKHDCCVLYSPIAHKSILECVSSCKNKSSLKVDGCGFVDAQNLKDQMKSLTSNVLVVLDYANSEIGVIQNVKDICDIVHSFGGTVFLDCTGSISTIPVDVVRLDVDMLSFSAHKLGGLKGCGILYKKSGIELEPIIYGNQEKGLVGGTENIIGIASLGKAIEDYDYSSISSEGRDYVYEYIIRSIPDSYLVGSPIGKNRLEHNLYICFRGIEGESLMMLMDMNGVQVSTGSACNSESLVVSSALSAIGMNEEDIHSCVRMTFSGKENKEEIDYVCRVLKDCVEQLRGLNMVYNNV